MNESCVGAVRWGHRQDTHTHSRLCQRRVRARARARVVVRVSSVELSRVGESVEHVSPVRRARAARGLSYAMWRRRVARRRILFLISGVHSCMQR